MKKSYERLAVRTGGMTVQLMADGGGDNDSSPFMTGVKNGGEGCEYRIR